MQNLYSTFHRHRKLKNTAWVFLLATLFWATPGLGQQENLTCNQITNWESPTFSDLSVDISTSGYTGTTSSGKDNIINNDPESSASITLVSRVYGLLCTSTQDAQAIVTISDGVNSYQLGNYVGLITSNPNQFSALKIELLNGNTVVYTSSNPYITDLGGGKYEIGALSNGAGTYNRIRLTIDLEADLGLLNCNVRQRSINIYGASQVRHCSPVDLVCNTETNVSLPLFNLSVNGSGSLGDASGAIDIRNVISPSKDDYGKLKFTLLSLTAKWIEVTDNVNTYEGGTFAGFEIENNDFLNVALLSDVTIETFLDGNSQESKTGSNVLVSGGILTNSGRKTIGFVTELPFNGVRITMNGVNLGAGEIRVYNLVTKKFCEAPSIPCNTLTYLTNPDFPVSPEWNTGGLLNISIGNASITDLKNLTDSDTSNYAVINTTVDLLGTVSLAVKKEGNDFASGTFVGFDIETVGVAGLDIINNIRVATYINGQNTALESFSGANLLTLGSPIVSGTGRQIVGFKSSQAFDEVRLELFDVAGLNLTSTRVYGAVIRNFCDGPALDCNTITQISGPDHPVYINSSRTGISGAACATCSINYTENIIDSNPDNYASVILPLAVLSDAKISVANAMGSYPEKTFAGFEIGTATLLVADLLNSIDLVFYKDGSEVQTISGPPVLLTANTSLLDGVYNRHYFGAVCDYEFDEVQIVFSQPLSANLGTIRVYNFVVSNSCGTNLTCGTSYYLTQSAFPAYINPERTGVSGVLGALGGVKDAWNVVSSDTDDFARLTTDANVAGSTSLSVVDALHVYPKGTIAGFTIVTHPSLVELDLLDAVVISTYLNGQYQESSISANLIDLELLNIPILGPGANRYNLGFITSKPFNEIVISTVSLVKADVFNQIDVYGAYVDTRFSSSGGSLNCVKSNPDINVAYVGIEVEGDVSTNDVVGPTDNVTYTSVAVRSGYTNPSSDMPVLQSDGTYTFLPTTVGRFHFIVNYCNTLPDTTFCDFNYLTITVTDPDELDNPPVINTDIASTVGQTPVTIPVLENDKPGNEGGTLGNITIVTPPPAEQGSVEIVGNNIIFTPAADFFGKVEFQYSACETPSDQCGIADVVVHVYPLGTIGVAATDDYYQTKAGVEFNISAPGILGNDFSLDGGPLTASTLDNPGGRIAALFANNGTISINADGSFTYQSQANFNGTDAFVYQACATGDTCATATIYISVNTADPLPVQLRNFNLSREGTQAHLSWETTEEVKFSHFEVERSFEGKNWHRLTHVTAAGIPSKYHYSDESPADGVNYYRLRMVDQDGSFAYSDVKSLMFNLNLAEVTVSPNPAVDKIRLNIRDLKNVERIQMLSASGQVVYQTTSDFASEINVRHLPAGIYMVVLTHTGGRVTTHKVLKN